jgi:LPS-assembly protein
LLRSVIRRHALALAFALAVPRAFALIPGQPYMEADRMEGDLDTNVTIYRVHALMRDGPVLLTGDEIRYSGKTETVAADGHVTFTRGDLRLLADHLTYRRTDGSFSAINVRVGRYPIYIEGSSADGSNALVVVHHAKVTYGEPGPYQPTVKAETIIYEPGRYMRFIGSLIGVGNDDFFPVPHFNQDFGGGSPLALLTFDVGYRSYLGGTLDIGLHQPIFPGARLGGDLGIYTSHGVMLGPTGTYKSADGSDDVVGTLESGYIYDYGNRGYDILGNPIQPNRAFLEWTHRQQVTDNLTVAADLNYWSDSSVTRDFRNREFETVQMPDNYVESVYAGDDYFASFFTRFRPNTFEPVQERLPELSFELAPTAIGGGFYERAETSAVSLVEWPPGTGGPELASNRLDAFYELSYPISPTDWLTFTPVAGARLTNYSDTVGAALPGGYTRALGEVGFDALMRSSGTFDYENPTWEIDGLRHLLTPHVSYRYIPNANDGSAYIPDIDAQTFNTYLQPLDLGDIRYLDQLYPVNTLRVGVDNTLQTRDPAYGSRDLVTFDVDEDFNFTRTPVEPDVSDLHTEFTLTPAPWLTYDIENIVSPKTMTLREVDSALTLHDGDAWHLELAEDFLRHEDDDYLLDYRQRLNEVYEVLFAVEYGARLFRLNTLETGLVQNLGNTWSVRYLLTYDAKPNRASGLGFNLQVETLRY